MALSLKKQQTFNPECISDVLASIRYEPPQKRGEHGFVSILGSPPVLLDQLTVWGHTKSAPITLKVVGYTDFLILSRFFEAKTSFQNWYPRTSRPSDRQRHWEFVHASLTVICIRQWGEGKG